jgi:hypothetical protein
MRLGGRLLLDAFKTFHEQHITAAIKIFEVKPTHFEVLVSFGKDQARRRVHRRNVYHAVGATVEDDDDEEVLHGHGFSSDSDFARELVCTYLLNRIQLVVDHDNPSRLAFCFVPLASDLVGGNAFDDIDITDQFLAAAAQNSPNKRRHTFDVPSPTAQQQNVASTAGGTHSQKPSGGAATSTTKPKGKGKGKSKGKGSSRFKSFLQRLATDHRAEKPDARHVESGPRLLTTVEDSKPKFKVRR